MTTTRVPMTLASAHTAGPALVRAHTERFIDLVRELDGAALDRRVHGGTWTVGDTITHVESVYLRYSKDHRRADTPQAVATQNAEDLERLGPDVERSVATMRELPDILDAVVPSIAPDAEFPFHARRTVTMAGGMGNLLGELLAHGDDVARATGRSFTIPSEDLEILWRYTAPLLDGWLRPEASSVSDAWIFRFEFGDLDAVFDRGILRWNTGATSADQEVVVTDATAFTLAFPYRRRTITDATLALFAARFYDV